MKRAAAKRPAAFDANAGPHGLKWLSPTDSLRVMTGQLKPSQKVAAFDMDGTWVTPKNPAQKFPSSRTDWAWWNDAVPTELARLTKEGYHVVIFSNQGGAETGQTTDEAIMGKIFDLAEALGFGFTAYLALAKDQWRKPGTTMWNHFVEHHNGKVEPTEFFYCGDAAGRAAAWDGKKTTKKDFSCSDRKFAANIGARFVTPEELFLKQQPTKSWSWGGPPPKELMAPYMNKNIAVPALDGRDFEVLIMVGFPASGKSTISKRFEKDHGYCRVSNDEMGSKAKCLKVAKDALGKKKSVVVDNTNPGTDVRREWTTLAKQFGATVRCIHVNTPLHIARHLNLFREAIFGVKRIPDVAINTYNKNFVAPNAAAEGFVEVITVPFRVSLPSKEAETQFLNWT